MCSHKQGLPGGLDRELQGQAEATCAFAEDLVEWAGEFAARRSQTEFAISPEDLGTLDRLRRRASSLVRASKVSPAAAVYGASQSAKSLFLGRMLTPADARDSPLGRSDLLGPPGYFSELCFRLDLSPPCESDEGTALVARFTTGARFDETSLPEYSVKAVTLTRADWLCVLARGFLEACKRPRVVVWGGSQLLQLLAEVRRDDAADRVDREWSADLSDAYAYVHGLEPRKYETDPSMFETLLSLYPVGEAGCMEIAGRLFWDRRDFPALSPLFGSVCRFLKKTVSQGKDGVLLHWAAVKFLLDGRRSTLHEVPESRWQKKVAWKDLSDGFKNGWYVIDYEPGGAGPSEDLATIQAALREVIIPVIPLRLYDEWRNVFLEMDVLDLPAIRSGGDNAASVARIETAAEVTDLIHRGKLLYLMDRYLDERLIQTLLLLVHGAPRQASGFLKKYVETRTKRRYGDNAWPQDVNIQNQALCVAVAAMGEEFESVECSTPQLTRELRQEQVRIVREELRSLAESWYVDSAVAQGVFKSRAAAVLSRQESAAGSIASHAVDRRTAQSVPSKDGDADEKTGYIDHVAAGSGTEFSEQNPVETSGGGPPIVPPIVPGFGPATQTGRFGWWQRLRRDRVDCTVFAPPEARAGDALLVQVFAHLPRHGLRAEAAARICDDEAKKRGAASLGTLILRGSVLTFRLVIPPLCVREPVKELIWNREPRSVQFAVGIPDGTRPQTAIGTVFVLQDTVPIGEVSFKVRVLDETECPADPMPAGTAARRYRRAFISYSSSDRPEVLRRTSMLTAVGLKFFQDLLSLEPGDEWLPTIYQYIDQSDVFLLFWSTSAKQSQWVEKEWRRALARGRIGFIRPVIIEGPPIPAPPAELAHLHFNDYTRYLLPPRV